MLFSILLDWLMRGYKSWQFTCITKLVTRLNDDVIVFVYL